MTRGRAPQTGGATGAQGVAQQRLTVDQAVRHAHALCNAGQRNDARRLCNLVLEAAPDQTETLHLLGLMAHADGNLDEAVGFLRRACATSRAPAAYHSNFAEMCRQKGLLAEGEQAARRAVALDPAMSGAWNNLGIVLQESGQLEESRQCLERVLALQPNDPQAHNNLGNTCKRLGLLDQAETHWSRAAALSPGYAEPLSNLAHLLRERGELDRAAELGQRAIALNPRLADAYVNLAGVEEARSRHAEALRWLDLLLSFAPLHAGGLAARALALKNLHRYPEALASAERAVAVNPHSDDAHNTLGMAQQALGQFGLAQASFDRAVALPGLTTEKAMVNRALLFMETGRREEALAAFDRVLRGYPRSALALFNVADMATFKAGDPRLEQMEQLLGPSGLQSPADRLLLHFAVGKAYLDIGDSARAFAHLHEGNRSKRSLLSYDAAAATAWMAGIAAAFSPASLARFVGHGAASTLPVFVLGMPRSGTTLVEQILASHPAVAGAGELPHLPALADQAGYPAPAASMTPEAMRHLGETYLSLVAPLAEGKRHVVDKMPANFLYIGLIAAALPGARIVHCRRDPVDTCVSCYSKLFQSEQDFSYDLRELGLFHRDYRRLMEHWRTVVPPETISEVDYEAVVEDVEREARRTIAFLGLDWDPACLSFHRTERAIRTASVNQVRQPIYRGSVGRWRKHAEHLGPLLEALRG